MNKTICHPDESGIISKALIQSKRAMLKIDELSLDPENNIAVDDNSSELDELKESITQLGLLRPLIVFPDLGTYTVICGNRRLKALRQCGLDVTLHQVPVYVLPEDISLDDVAKIRMEDNLSRNKTLFQQALEWKQMMDMEGPRKRSASKKYLEESDLSTSRTSQKRIRDSVSHILSLKGKEQQDAISTFNQDGPTSFYRQNISQDRTVDKKEASEISNTDANVSPGNDNPESVRPSRASKTPQQQASATLRKLARQFHDMGINIQSQINDLHDLIPDEVT